MTCEVVILIANYIVKLVDYEKFSEMVKHLGLFISLVQIPAMGR